MSGKTSEQYISQKTAIEKYGVTKKIIEQYFPKPLVRYGRRGRYSRLWRKSEVEAAVQRPEVRALIAEVTESRRRNIALSEAAGLLAAYTPESLIEKAKKLRRAFVLHAGPTNSGKTHDALESLKVFSLVRTGNSPEQTETPGN